MQVFNLVELISLVAWRFAYFVSQKWLNINFKLRHLLSTQTVAKFTFQLCLPKYIQLRAQDKHMTHSRKISAASCALAGAEAEDADRGLRSWACFSIFITLSAWYAHKFKALHMVYLNAARSTWNSRKLCLSCPSAGAQHSLFAWRRCSRFIAPKEVRIVNLSWTWP